MGRTGKWIVAVLGTAGLILGAMQNCSQVDFKTIQEQVEAAPLATNNVLIVGSEPVQLAEDVNSDGGRPVDGGRNETSVAPTSGDSMGVVVERGTLACGALQVRDVIIDILSIEVSAGQGQTYQLNIGSGPADLLDLANGIDFIPDRNLSITQLRIMLGEENYVLTVDDEIYPLKTSNQQVSGLIALLGGRTDLAKDVTYHLSLDFDPRFQVKRAGAECQLHPNVSARIE